MEPFNVTTKFLDIHIEKGRSNVNVIYETSGKVVTYENLFVLVKQFCSYLSDFDIRCEERIVIAMADSSLLVAAFLAVIRIGAVSVTINPEDNEKVVEICESVKARIVISDRILSSESVQVINIPNVIAKIETMPQSNFIANTTSDSPCFWLPTSGTTGKPKFVMHRHLSPILLVEALGEYTQPELRYCVSPIFFSYGLYFSMFATLYSGGSTILHPHRPISPTTVIDIVHTFKPQLLYWVPSGYAALLPLIETDSSKIAAFQCLERCYTGGEVIPPHIRENFVKLTGITMHDYLGTTECGVIFRNGYPLDNVDIKQDENNVVYVKSAAQAGGYYNNYKATQTAFQGEWYCTQDVCVYFEGRGYVHQGRADDLMKVYGKWLSPMKIEECMKNHPNIQASCCVGQINEEGLTEVVLFIILKDKSQIIDEQEIASFCITQGLETYSIPRRVACIESFPMTASGKLLRSVLRKQIIPRHISTLQQDLWPITYESYQRVIKSVFPLLVGKDTEIQNQLLQQMNISVTFNENGFDSSTLVRFVNIIRMRMQVSIPMDVVFTYSIDAIWEYIQSHQHNVNVESQDIQPNGHVTSNNQDKEIQSNGHLPIVSTISNNQLSIVHQETNNSSKDWIKEINEVDNLLSQLHAHITKKKALTVFLTGVTGHLGIFILEQLLFKSSQQFSDDIEKNKMVIKKDIKKVYVHLRGDKSRFIETAKLNGLEYILSDPRIEIILGDLSQPQLGINDHIWKMLSVEVDVIIHNGAEVNWIKPYSTLKASNVTSTLELLRLCTSTTSTSTTTTIDNSDNNDVIRESSCFNKRFIFISSIGAYYDNEDIVEERIPYIGKIDSMMGYGATKRVSEMMIYKAIDRGLDGYIVRPATITGSSITGYSNRNDAVNRFLQSIIQLQSYPLFPNGYMVSMSPVDYVASVIHHLTVTDHNITSGVKRGYNVTGITPILYSDIITAISNTLDIQLNPVSLQQFLYLAEESHVPVAPLVNFFNNRHRFPLQHEGSIYPHGNTDSLGVISPIVNKNVITKYAKYLSTV